MPAANQFAQAPEQVGVDPAKLEALFARAEREVREGLLPSVQIAVARQGKIAAMRTFGQVTHEGVPAAATNDTLYVVFSATKAITSAAAWLLMQEGTLDAAERVADIIPGFESNGKERVLVEHLLTHTAGFPYAPYAPAEWNDRDARVARFRRWRSTWEPGTRFEYHPTSSMWVVAEIIERRSGQRYTDFIRARIATPLGLPDLSVGLASTEHGRVADIVPVGSALTAEEMRARGWPELPQTDVNEDSLQVFNQRFAREAGVPGGGGVMTAAEIALFYQALIAGGRAADGTQVWRPETIRTAREVRTGDLTDPLFGKRVMRGLGIVIAGDDDRVFRGFGRTGSAAMFGHNGAGGQIAWGDPESGISLGYCTNGLDRDPLRQARRTVAMASLAAVCAA